jgi:hypothetical protein
MKTAAIAWVAAALIQRERGPDADMGVYSNGSIGSSG